MRLCFVMSNSCRRPNPNSGAPRRLPAIAALALLLLLSPFPALAAAFPGKVPGKSRADGQGYAVAVQAEKKPSPFPPPRRFRPFSGAATAMASSITRRGGGKSASTLRAQPDPEDKEAKIAREALDSIRSCGRSALAAFVSDVIVTLAEHGTWSRRKLTWLDAVDLFDSLNLLVFAHGLWRVSSIYAASLDSTEQLSPGKTLDLCATMAGLWRNTALVLVGVSMSQAASLGEVLEFLPGKYSLPGCVAAIALVGRLALGKRCARNAADAVEREGSAPVMAGYDRARSMGFVASRNMRFCMGSFALMAAVQFASWLLKPSDLVGRIFSVFDFITPATIAGLLLALYQSFLRAVVNATAGRSVKAEGYPEYSDLFEAQKGFYDKAEDTLRSQAIFALLPYAFEVLKPYLLAVFKFVTGRLGLVEAT